MRRGGWLGLLFVTAPLHAQGRVAAAASLTVNAATVPSTWRSPATLGVRYTLPIAGPLALQAGGMMQLGNVAPAIQRLRYDGAGFYHWGAGLRYRVGAVTLLGEFARVDRLYGDTALERRGYYADLAPGIEVGSRWGFVRLEGIAKTLRQWNADEIDLILRGSVGRLMFTGEHITPWRSGQSFVVGSATVRLVGPLGLTAGWMAANPEGSHRLTRVPVLGVTATWSNR